MNFPSVTALSQGFNTFRSGTPITHDHHALFSDVQTHHHHSRDVLNTDLLETIKVIYTFRLVKDSRKPATKELNQIIKLNSWTFIYLIILLFLNRPRDAVSKAAEHLLPIGC
jgi:hypothetical protein